MKFGFLRDYQIFYLLKNLTDTFQEKMYEEIKRFLHT